MAKPGWITHKVEAHEQKMIKADAKAHGVSMSSFMMLLYRNWRLERKSLYAIPAPPAHPWEHTKQ